MQTPKGGGPNLLPAWRVGQTPPLTSKPLKTRENSGSLKSQHFLEKLKMLVFDTLENDYFHGEIP